MIIPNVINLQLFGEESDPDIKGDLDRTPTVLVIGL